MCRERVQVLEVVLADYILKFGLTEKAEAYFQTIFSDDELFRDKSTTDANSERDDQADQEK